MEEIIDGLIPLFERGVEFFKPKEAEAKSRKGFEEDYVNAVMSGYPNAVYAGTLESDKAFEDAKKRDKDVKNNSVYAKKHGGEARFATGEMTPEESAMHIANLLNSPGTVTLPNFPSSDPLRPKAMFYNNDGVPITTPFKGRRDGNILITTLFQPNNTKWDFVKRYLGSPKFSPISGPTPEREPSTQPQGFSVVEAPLTEESMPYDKTNGNHEEGLGSPLFDPFSLIPFGVGPTGKIFENAVRSRAVKGLLQMIGR